MRTPSAISIHPTHFSARWSTSLKVTTAFVLILVFAIVAFGVGTISGANPKQNQLVGGLLMIALPLLVVILTSFFAIRGFEVTPNEILVHRLKWNTRIPLSGLTGAEADPNAAYGSIRLFGVGGLYCYCGLFRNSRLGNFRLYATNLANSVVLTFSTKTIVVTADDPACFIGAVKSKR